jgi:hypothetical protein
MIDKETKLFHGSYMVVEKPDLKKCEAGKDFGKGFYLTTDVDQARRFVKSAVGKALKNGMVSEPRKKGYVSIFTCGSTEGLRVFEFKTADKEWLHCVASHRRSGLMPGEEKKWKDYDIIVGKIANDNTNQVITAYINGVYGEVGSDTADRIAIGLLLPEKLTDQICFRTQKAINTLTYTGCEERYI